MRESGEHPLIPEPTPEEDVHPNRFESAGLDIETVKSYIEDTRFENLEELKDTLSSKFDMTERESFNEIQSNMTRVMKMVGLGKDRKIIENKPLSGKEPEANLIMSIDTIDGRSYYLMIFKVTNRNQKFRYEYILKAK